MKNCDGFLTCVTGQDRYDKSELWAEWLDGESLGHIVLYPVGTLRFNGRMRVNGFINMSARDCEIYIMEGFQ